MSEKEPEAKAKRENEKVLMEFIETHMGRSYEEIGIHDIVISKPRRSINREVRIAIAKWIQKEFEEKEELVNMLANVPRVIIRFIHSSNTSTIFPFYQKLI